MGKERAAVRSNPDSFSRMNSLPLGAQLFVISIFGVGFSAIVGALTFVVIALSGASFAWWHLLVLLGVGLFGFACFRCGIQLLHGSRKAWLVSLFLILGSLYLSAQRLWGQVQEFEVLWDEAERGNSHALAGLVMQACVVLFLFYVLVQLIFRRRLFISKPSQ